MTSGGCLNMKKENVMCDATQRITCSKKAKCGLAKAFQYSRFSVEIHQPEE